MTGKLKLLASFFENDVLLKIYLRTQVIHQLFENNNNLDSNKLSLFHVQYTQSLIDLLKKIKKNNEQQISLILDEVQLNQELIEKLSAQLTTAKVFENSQQQQQLKLSVSLRKLYQVLSGHSSGYPFSRNINSFSARFAGDFYAETMPEIWSQIMNYQAEEVYGNADAVIHKKLMGQLCKYEFKCSFFYGIKMGGATAEIYRLAETERCFLFNPAQNLLLFLEPSVMNTIDFSPGNDSREKIISELKNKNYLLQSRINLVKKQLPKSVINLLSDHYRKLNELDFLSDGEGFEAQARILKTMLDTDMI